MVAQTSMESKLKSDQVGQKMIYAKFADVFERTGADDFVVCRTDVTTVENKRLSVARLISVHLNTF
jgi:hypothetical protein